MWCRSAGLDGPARRALPAGEFLHPLALLALVILALNDHLLKGSGWLPGAVTGKLSDVAGLAFFPLLLTAVLDTLLLVPARLGARIDFSLRWYKTIIATITTAAVFAALKLIPSVARAAEDSAASIGWGIEIIADPTDLIALPALLVALAIAAAELRRMPLGRLEVIERRGVIGVDSIRELVADVETEHREQLARAIARFLENGETGPLDDALRQLRGRCKGASGEQID